MTNKDWTIELLGRLKQQRSWGYHQNGQAATEPTALAAMALIAYGHAAEANTALSGLAQIQSADGSLGIFASEPTPRWPTSLAILAWTAYGHTIGKTSLFQRSIDRALQWTLLSEGSVIDASEIMGHDGMLIGWPWVVGNHSWIEPTAMHILALKASGLKKHDRTRQAIRLLVNRLLPNGGCNYGNTFVFGQALRPHIQPTGLSLLALAGEGYADPRIERSITFLEQSLSARSTTTSLCHGLLGLAAHRRTSEVHRKWLAAAYHRTLARDSSPYKLALLALAALGGKSPLITLPANADSS